MHVYMCMCMCMHTCHMYGYMHMCMCMYGYMYGYRLEVCGATWCMRLPPLLHTIAASSAYCVHMHAW